MLTQCRCICRYRALKTAAYKKQFCGSCHKENAMAVPQVQGLIQKEGGGRVPMNTSPCMPNTENVKGITFVSVSFFCLYSYCSISISKHYSHKWCCSWQDTLLLKSLTKSTNHQNKIRDRSVVGNGSISVVLVKRLHFWFSYSWFLDSENNFGLVQFESPVLTVVFS